ncbi:hypothetical protein D3C72_1825980 [compost metagenome]
MRGAKAKFINRNKLFIIFSTKFRKQFTIYRNDSADRQRTIKTTSYAYINKEIVLIVRKMFAQLICRLYHPNLTDQVVGMWIMIDAIDIRLNFESCCRDYECFHII